MLIDDRCTHGLQGQSDETGEKSKERSPDKTTQKKKKAKRKKGTNQRCSKLSD